jgi:pantoate--beta-alanine ligase
MIIVKTRENLNKTLTILQKEAKTIGFVPTMGALHQGHIALITAAKKENDLVVCSIFVNPTQFNNSADLAKYPRTIEADIEKLEAGCCNVLFLPEVAEMYPENEIAKQYNLGYLETILEGKYRPGHFQGVCIIVDKLLAAVQPTTLYLGSKDYQQCMVVKKMMETEHANINLNIVETIREKSGLAMSSRNMRLSNQEKETATNIFKTLQNIKSNIKTGELQPLKNEATKMLVDNGFEVDYVEIALAENLKLVEHWDGKTKLVALMAATIGQVRLIDNTTL